MHLESPANERTVDDYDFYYSSGTHGSASVDQSKGDTITETEANFLIYLAPRTVNYQDMPAETIIVFKNKLDSYLVRKRVVLDRTPEEQEDWQNLIKEVSKFTH